MANKPGVMIYFETAKAVKGLDFETKGRLFDAIMEYAEDGVIPAFDGVLSAVWPFIADKIDRDTMRYTDVVTKRKRAQYVRWWNEHAKKNDLNPDDEQLRERWIDIQMYSNDTNVSDVIQMIPTITGTTTGTTSGTAAGALTACGSSPRAPYGLYENVFLTPAEHEALTADIPEVERVIEKLSIHIASTGRKYESHAATVRKWAMEDAERQKRAASRSGGDWCSGITPEDYKNDIDVPW